MGLSKKSQDFNTNLELLTMTSDCQMWPWVRTMFPSMEIPTHTRSQSCKQGQSGISRQIQEPIGTLGISKEPDICEHVIPFIKPFPPALPEDERSKIEFVVTQLCILYLFIVYIQWEVMQSIPVHVHVFLYI